MSNRPAIFNLTLSKMPVSIDEHVRWGDMDAFNHLNNAEFFRLFESSRMAYFSRIGFADPADNNGIGPILAHTECYFLKPLTYPQTLKVGARIAHLEEDRLSMDYGVFIEGEKPVLAACGTGKIVCYDYEKGARSPIPSIVSSRISDLEATVTSN